MTDKTGHLDDGVSRRQILAGAIGAGGAAVAAGVFPGAATAQKESAAEAEAGRSYAAGHFSLEMDGKASELQNASGGDPLGLVIEEPVPPGQNAAKKHIANVKWNECKMELGMGLAPGIYDWIQHSWDKGYQRKSGSVVAADFDYREVSRVNFTNAVITEVGFPALDAASKDAGKMSVTFNPETIAKVKGGRYPIGAGKQKAWLCSNFRLRIDGVDTTRVSKIDSFSIKQNFVQSAGGALAAEPGKIQFPDLTFYLAESDSASAQAWFDDFVIAGNNDDSKQKNGSLIMLDPTRQKTLLEITLSGLGIFKGTAEASENNSDRIRAKRIGYSVWCEDMKLKF